jgi:hypothetical protein
VGVK